MVGAYRSFVVAVGFLAVLGCARVQTTNETANQDGGNNNNASTSAPGRLRAGLEVMPTTLKSPKPSTNLAEHGGGIERLLGILGYSHLRARVVRKAIFVESGPLADLRVRLRFSRLPRENWRVDVRTNSGRWEPIPFVGPRGNMVAWIHQDFTWLLAPDPSTG